MKVTPSNDRKHPSRRARAFGLLDAMMMLLLLTAFLVISSELFASIFRAQREYRARDELISHIDNAVDLLRRDVWSASSMNATGARLELDTPAGWIVWQMSADGTLTRSAAATPPRNWSPLPRLRFAAEGPLVTLISESSPGNPEEHLTLSSAMLLCQTQATSTGGRP